MQNRLAMEADQVDGPKIQPLLPAKTLHCLGMGAGEEGFSLGQYARTAGRISETARIGQSRPKQPPLRLGIRPRGKPAEPNLRLAVRLDKSNVDPVEGRAGHQAYGAGETHGAIID
jgi:hypothetical protein